MAEGKCIVCGGGFVLVPGRSKVSKNMRAIMAQMNRTEDLSDKLVARHKVGGKACRGGNKVPVEAWDESVAAMALNGKDAGPGPLGAWMDEWAFVRLSALEPWDVVKDVWLVVLRHLKPTPIMREAIEYEKGVEVGWLEDFAKYLTAEGKDRGCVKEFIKHRGLSDDEWMQRRVESVRQREEYAMLVKIVGVAREDPTSFEPLLRHVYPMLEEITRTFKNSSKERRQAECLEQIVLDLKAGLV